MAITYGLSLHPNPRNPQGPKKFYAHVKSSGETTTRELATEISKRTGLSVSDVIAVIEGFIDLVPERISAGHIVRLGDFGSYSVSVSSEGVDKEEDFTPAMIKSSKMHYRPGKIVRKVLETAEYKKEKKA